jgi:dynein heavy chain, axonemal
MSENCKMVFEVENLNNASPATVSRCGIVYVSDSDLGFEPIIIGWLNKRRKDGRSEECDKLEKVLKKYFLDGNDFT